MLNIFLDSQHHKLRIGELFVKKGLISETQLEQALVLQRQSPKKIGKILVEQQFISDKDLTIALVEQWCLNSVIAGLWATAAIVSSARGVRAEGTAEATVTFSGYLAPSVTLVTSGDLLQTSFPQQSVFEDDSTTSSSVTVRSNTGNEQITVRTTEEYQTLTVN